MAHPPRVATWHKRPVMQGPGHAFDPHQTPQRNTTLGKILPLRRL